MEPLDPSLRSEDAADSPSEAQGAVVFYHGDLPSGDCVWGGDSQSLVGCDPGEMPRSRPEWRSRIHPDDRLAVERADAEFLSNRTPLAMRYRVRHRNGNVRLVSDEAAFVADDRFVGALCSIDRPTAAAITELDLVRFFELSLDLFVIANLDGYFLRVNANFSRVLGYTEQELLSRPFLDFVHPDDRQATIAATSNLSSGRPVVQFRNRYRDVRQEFHWLEWTARSVMSEGRIYAVARDITEARMAEAQRIARVGSWDWKIASDYAWWSDEYYRILGYRAGDVEPGTKAFFERVHPDDREVIERWLEGIYRGEVPKGFEFRIVRPDGVERVLWADARFERDAEGRPYRLMGTCQDITENRRALEEKEMMQRALQESQKLESLGVLAGGIAHDFNNLLSAIMGNASLISLKLPANSPARPCLDRILQASDRAAALCRQMLAYSGRGRFVLTQIDLSRAVREMIDLFKMSISKKIDLELNLAGDLPSILADATQIGQVVMDLVINASESIGDRPGRIRVSTRSQLVDSSLSETTDNLPDGTYVVLEVSDTGSGMDETTRGRIFEPFFTTKFTGRGLGLAAVIGIVRGHKGSIHVESEVGVGSTFRLYLPANSGDADATPTAKTIGDTMHGHGTVLIADDDSIVRETSARMLHTMGFRVIEAADGEDALNRFREAPDAIRLALLDLTMPKLDGEEVFRNLNALRPQLPVILMSGFSEQEATGRFAGMGLAGFLAKPFTFKQLAASVHSALHDNDDPDKSCGPGFPA